MPRSPYKWDEGGTPPTIKQHSVAKLEVLRAYLAMYFQTLVGPTHDVLNVTFVDGFTGGGVYEHENTRAEILGSPFVFLEAAAEAEAAINSGRRKPFRIDAEYFLIDKNKNAISALDKNLRNRGFGQRIGHDVHLVRNSFEKAIDTIRESILKKTPRRGRAIFFLDQYGYKDVPTPLIRWIFQSLPAAEIILTFNIDAFINFASDRHLTKQLLNDMGVPNLLRGRTIDEIKQSERDFRLFIQSCFYEDLVKGCGAHFYTVFFIRTSGHGDYWLVHLSQHPRARDVMTHVHWQKNTHFIHYGGSGIDMFDVLGYSPDRDPSASGQRELGFCFDDPAAEASIKTLTEQLPHLIYARPEGISFDALFTETCNSTPADSDKYRIALATLVQHKEIEIIGQDGKQRRSSTTIRASDQLLPSKQSFFPF
jgi:three-Cys-motif partner protein